MKNPDATKIILFASLTHFMVHIYENSFSGILKHLQHEWNVDYTALGSMGVPLFFLYGVMAVPGGWLSDRFGSKRLLLVCLFGAGLASLIASLTREVAGLHPMFVLSILLALLGLFSGFYHPAGLSFISRGLKRRGKAMGIHGVMGNLGLALSPFLAAWLASHFGWRQAFLVFSFPAFLIAFALLFSRFEPQSGAHSVSGKFTWREFFPKQENHNRIHPLLVLYVIAALNGLVYRGIVVYLPSYFKNKIGEASFLSLSGILLAGFLSTIVLLLGAAGQWGGGFVADWNKQERNFALTFLISAPLVLLMGYTGGFALVIVGILFAVVYFSLQPQKSCLMANYAHQNAQGLSYGFFFFLEFGIGSFGSSLAGMIADRWGMNYIFYISAVILLFLAAFSLLLIPRYRIMSETAPAA